MRLSVLVPVFNERDTVLDVLEAVKATGIVSEIVVVDDGSTDGTREVLGQMEDDQVVRVIFHEKNAGKGAALRTAMQAATGEVLLIQDADLEYHPRQYPKLLAPIEAGEADVVYGSRFLAGDPEGILRSSLFANKLLTFMTNVLFRNSLTDMETCYKVFRREVLDGISLRANRFDFEPEFTAKVLKRGILIHEVPVEFSPRAYEEGKKIGAWDGVQAVWALVRYRLAD
ncbi:MAG: glycosyltransferase family 2 protein [Coriobacteriia bacterium]|nr:glycosyltransferase family 2 protein [Coriobacteriia bacterium]